MSESLRHRGPDDSGMWLDPESGVFLGHRRLSIQDVSAMGRQPMISRSGRYVITYNGEIYNSQQLLRDLALDVGALKSTSDTAIILEAVDQWGLSTTLARLIGIFAFGLWDRVERALYIVRDHLGVKPIYWHFDGSSFAFASELRPLLIHLGPKARVMKESISLLLRHNCVPAPHSIVAGCRKLMPGSMLTVFARDRLEIEERTYWRLADQCSRRGERSHARSDEEWTSELRACLEDVVESQMISDVPLGAFLSGGVDSSIVVAAMSRRAPGRVRTFSIGSSAGELDESANARAVAHALHTDHTEMIVGSGDVLDLVPQLADVFDEPFADSSQLPTLIVSRLARASVTVALSGDGGDEVFGGYNRHVLARRMRDIVHFTPRVVRTVLAQALRQGGVEKWARWRSLVAPFLPRNLGTAHLAYHAERLAELLEVRDEQSIYSDTVSHWKDPAALQINPAPEPLTLSNDPARWPSVASVTELVMYLDSMTYLPDDILTKVDRASMSCGLEVRVPLLDVRLVKLAWQLPLHLKVANGQGKRILRNLLGAYLPSISFDRPKAGFGIPLGQWLRGPLREWAESLLEERVLREEGLFDPSVVRREWSAFLLGRTSSQYRIWDLLMLRAWLVRSGLGV